MKSSLLESAEAIRKIELPLFKTIKLGQYEGIDQLLGVLVFLKNRISDFNYELLQKVEITKKEKEVDFVKASVRQLTGKAKATTLEVYEAALGPKFGLRFCRPEDVFYLRVAYQGQPKYGGGSEIYMGMKPIRLGDNRDRFLFRVSRRDNGVRLIYADALYCCSNFTWCGSNVFVFRRPRNKVS